jgi:hypothetical protein
MPDISPPARGSGRRPRGLLTNTEHRVSGRGGYSSSLKTGDVLFEIYSNMFMPSEIS